MKGLVGYFGYGSLVNRETLATAFVCAYPARLKGWRRHWQSRGLDDAGREEIALLSVHRHDAAAIDGMLIIDREAHLKEVDLREARYDRHAIALEDLQFVDERLPGPLPERLFVYVGKQFGDAVRPTKLLQSYLDTVLAGYLREFGEEGLEDFIRTTIGLDRMIVSDRHAPFYSRTRPVPRETALKFDEILRRAGVRYEEN